MVSAAEIGFQKSEVGVERFWYVVISRDREEVRVEFVEEFGDPVKFVHGPVFREVTRHEYVVDLPFSDVVDGSPQSLFGSMVDLPGAPIGRRDVRVGDDAERSF